ncbi:hypothetical protein VOLCADRAFT_93560 [Volvox carteri f. nagariensis]|uniref:Amino acid transporter transmembrane domain-containing protein n=1 Tax=Volvox carteri f. nagariensis TaxID=3068 RepID=D8U2F9_VOLCA|nr:uncharacterized protein VOLCADRAFT_93560 [Volvox carteri f. nagariensis]EFJ46057.1 hypothetical protein VOLCADRAFT_93560 [Volvox carteri f. nagariensis]|eukprot:XP_002952807.1 hypothetical protein VOLCADRAFT_93560 [Volvox carteri f. nagariensis]
MAAALIITTVRLMTEQPPDADTGDDGSGGVRLVATAAAAANSSGWALLVRGGGWHSGTELVTHHGFGGAMVGVMDIVFSFSGQENWMRFLTGMADSTQFTASVALSTAVLTPLLALVGAAGYAARGNDLDPSRPITSELRPGGWSLVVNGCVLVSVLISYQINLNVWARLVLGLCGPRSVREQLSGGGGGGGGGESDSGGEEKHEEHGWYGAGEGAGGSSAAVTHEAPQRGDDGADVAAAPVAEGIAAAEGLVVVQLPAPPPAAAAAATAAAAPVQPLSHPSEDLEATAPSAGDIAIAAAAAASDATAALMVKGTHGKLAEAAEAEAGAHRDITGIGIGGDDDELSQPLLYGTHGTAAYRHYLEERWRRRRLERRAGGGRGAAPPLPQGSQRLLWLLLTCCGGCFGYVAAFLLPYFSEVVAVIASVGDMALMLGLPCLCALQLLRLSRGERMLCWFLTGLAVVLSVFGAVLSIERLVDKVHGSR